MGNDCQMHLDEISEKFKVCQKAFIALGDESRQLILLALLKSDIRGIRVQKIADKVHLTRPAVSHHLKILKEAEIVNVCKVGTKNYYYLDSKVSRWKAIHELIHLIYEDIQTYSEKNSHLK